MGMRKLIFAIAGVFLFIGIFIVVPVMFEYNPAAQYDINRFCGFVSGYPFAPPGETDMVKDMAQIMDFPMYSKSARNIRAAAMTAAPSERWELFKEGARQVGLKDYDCPSLREYLQRTVY